MIGKCYTKIVFVPKVGYQISSDVCSDTFLKIINIIHDGTSFENQLFFFKKKIYIRVARLKRIRETIVEFI
jgi:hypothetical protein